MNKPLTTTEKVRRMRAMITEIREAGGIWYRTRPVVWTRTMQVVLDAPPTTYVEAVPDDDDTDGFATLRDWARTAPDGAIVHIALYGAGESGELVDVWVCWIGTPDQDPVVAYLPNQLRRDTRSLRYGVRVS
jgi:hypothetical protein